MYDGFLHVRGPSSSFGQMCRRQKRELVEWGFRATQKPPCICHWPMYSSSFLIVLEVYISCWIFSHLNRNRNRLRVLTSTLTMWPHTICSPCLTGQTLWWIEFDMKLTSCLAFTFVIVDFLVDKQCRPQQPLLIYALYITVNDYF